MGMRYRKDRRKEEGGKREKGTVHCSSRFEVGEFIIIIIIIIIYHLPFGRLRLNLFYRTTEIERRHDTSSDIVEVSYICSKFHFSQMIDL